ncbi:hypothetical protein F5148DRAFT_218521 [Russula earlei]|uniref:Uncharacterized protein n=1 Tax=Russula earlei TaxID=71964 RepID=A0ACC0U4A4_9AGAM|nr:hypothetical protein F5148DRAFT_218521 [Russula earlei]
MTGTVTLRNPSEVQRLLKCDNTTPAGLYLLLSRIAGNHFRGSTVVAGGTNNKLDIIAIHGLNGHAFNSWTVDDVIWLRDLLPEQVPDARVLLSGYNVNLVEDTTMSRIKEHARLFIKSLQGLEEIMRGLIISQLLLFVQLSPPAETLRYFVCHSLGGLVLKQVCRRIEVARILVNIARISFRVNAKQQQLLSTLENDSVDRMDLAHSFRELRSKLKLGSFCQ